MEVLSPSREPSDASGQYFPLDRKYLKYPHFAKSNKSPRRYRTENRLVRATAKKYAHTWHTDSNPSPMRDFINLRDVPADRRRPELEQALGVKSPLRLYAMGPEKQARGRPTNMRHVRFAKLSDEAEGKDLALSSEPLPVDTHRRRPSLEREDAFRDESTSKRTRGVQLCDASEDAEVAKLYEMGLLYDEGEARARSQIFDLNSIPREEPVYSIRPSKRMRSAKGDGKAYIPLSLDLSFSDMGNDEMIARLMDSGHEVSLEDDCFSASTDVSESQSSRAFARLRVIYERSPSGESNATVDVDTSQPPDLMEDDYDCFSDIELGHGSEGSGQINEEEVLENVLSPEMQETGAWVVLGEDGCS